MNLTSLKALPQAAIDWLLTRDVSPYSIIMPSSIWLANGSRAKDGYFEPDESGPSWFVFEEGDDLIFWNRRTGELATDWGRAFALSEELIDNPWTCALDQYLNVYADPLQWLRKGRNSGIVVTKWAFAFDRLRHVTRIAVDESLLATLRRHMKPRHMPRLAVLPRAERRVAA